MITFTVDASALHAGLSALELDWAARTKAASAVTAAAIVREASGRVARRTGATAAGIHYVESRDGTGYVVLVVRANRPQVPFYLEFGTRYMDKRSFFYASAAVEQPGQQRRTLDAVEDAIQVNGFGG